MCKCIRTVQENMDAKFTETKPQLELSFSAKGEAYPYMSATYEKKSGRGFKTVHVIVLPTFCPFCGKRYHRGRK